MLENALFGSPDGSGTSWRLLGAGDDVARSKHYVRLKFDIIGGQLQGVLIAWNRDEEIPLVDVQFDGIRLSMRLPQADASAGAAAAARSPRLSLVMYQDTEFRGFYVDEMDRRVDPDHVLKLVKVGDQVTTL